jgi:outer membrane protein insertion porin family
LAQTAPAPDRIREIRIEGNQRVETATIESYLLIRPGDVYDAGRVDRSLKDLYATGLFTDVTIHLEGDVLYVTVQENPIINRLAFEGNDRLSDEVLGAEIQSRPRVVYTRAKVESDAKRILEIYRRSGRFAASVIPKVIQLSENRVDLVFEINEGGVTKIEKINFIGNRRFSDKQLRGGILTKETRWYRFFAADDTYDPDRLSFDRELLRRFYLKNGYADFRVISAVAELGPKREKFFVTFTIEEGQRYRFGNIKVETHLKDLDLAQLRELVTVNKGDWFDNEEVEKIIDAMTDFAGRFGYAFVDIRPRIQRDPEARTIDVTFVLEEGPRVYVERINVTGNVRTRDNVIRREFRLIEGDSFNTAKLNLSQQRVRNLGFFERVDVERGPGSAPDRTVVNVNVEEKATGELSIGAGFSSTEGVLGNIGLRERNFLGRGQDLQMALLVSQRTQQADISFTEPYFLSRNLAAGFDLFRITLDRQDESSFDEDSLGFALRAGYQVTEPLRQTWRYTVRQDEITDVPATASRFIREQAGKRTTSAVGQTLLYDRRNDRFDPTDGYFAQLGNDAAGLGGDVEYLRTIVSGGYFYPFSKDWVASITGKAGIIFGLAGDDVRINDRFFLGQDTMRGFDLGGIGPRDRDTQDALGGNRFYTASLELIFPLGLPKAFGISGSVFSDVGSLWDVDDVGPEILDTESVRASVGVGVAWRSPFGPVRLDFGVPVLKEDFDDEEPFRFSFGTRF